MQLITISVAELKVYMREAVKVELEIFKSSINKKRESKYLTRKATAILLSIDLSTLYRWTEDKKLKSYRIVGRVYYKRSEVEKCLTGKN